MNSTSTVLSDADEARDTASVRVLLADDHPLILAGIRRTIEGCEDIDVVGEARSASELLQLIERRNPTLVVVDLRMPDADGAAHIEEIRERWPQLKIIVVSACDDAPSIDSALRAGANAYVLKSAAALDVASVIRQVAGGAVFHAPPIAPRAAAAASGEDEDVTGLTDRERTILTAVGTGLTTAAISKDLWVSEHTIKFHLTNIYRKIGVSNRAGAVRYALQHGFVRE